MDAALFSTFIIGINNFVFTLASFWVIDRWGRKPLYIAGSLGMAASLVALAVAAALGRFQGTLVLALVLAYLAFFASCIGPVFWTLVSEIFPNRIRGTAMAVPVFVQWIANALVVLFFPLAFHQLGKVATFGFLAAMALAQALFTWFFRAGNQQRHPGGDRGGLETEGKGRGMTSRQRMLTALSGGVPDRLPATTHHVMPAFLASHLGGASDREFFDRLRPGRHRLDGPPPPGSGQGRVCRPAASRARLPRKPPRGGRPLAHLSGGRLAARAYAHALSFRYARRGTHHGCSRTRVTRPGWWSRWSRRSAISTSSAPGPRPPGCDVEAVNRAAGAFGERGIVRGPYLLFRRFRPARLLAGRLLPGRPPKHDPGRDGRPRLGPRVPRHPPAPQNDVHRIPGRRALRPARVRRRRRLRQRHLPAHVRRVRGALRCPAHRRGARGRPAHRLPPLRTAHADAR